MNSYNFFSNRQFAGALWLALVLTLAGCIIEPVGRRDYVVAPIVRTEPVVIVEAGMYYYPYYEVYYDSAARIYWYPRGTAWISGPAPAGVTVDILLASPSVTMDFRGSPANHHATIVQQYPREWKSSGPGPAANPGRGVAPGPAANPGRGRSN